MLYSQPYILYLVFILAVALFQLGMPIEEKSRKYLNFLLIVSYVFFMGFRGFVGWDWVNYYPFFKEVPDVSSFSVEKAIYDVGFSFFASILKYFNPDYQFFILLNTLVNVTLLYFVLKRYVPTYLFAFSFAVFFVMEGLILEVNLMRNIKGILLFLISLKYVEERKLLKFLSLNLLGITMHWSSVVFLPLYFFLHKKLEIKFYLLIFIIGVIVYLLQFEFVKPFVSYVTSLLGEAANYRANSYLKSSIFGSQYGITIGFIERILTTIIVLLHYEKLIEKSKSNLMFLNSFLIFIVVYLYFSEITIFVNRIGILFIYSYWILWPKIIELNNIKLRYFFFIGFSMYLFVRINSMTNNVMYKYDNVLIKTSMSYEERLGVYEKNYILLR